MSRSSAVSSQKSIADDHTPLPPPPTCTKIHDKWAPCYTHSAQCDGCHTKKHPVLQRCLRCTLQYCRKCMVKARLNGHEYVDGELDWDVGSRPREFRDHGSWKKMEVKGEMGVRRSRLGAWVRGGEVEQEDDHEALMVGEMLKRSEMGMIVARASFATTGSRSSKSPSKQRFMTEEEKYRARGNTSLFGGPKNTPDSSRYASDATLLDDTDDDGDLESDDDFEIPLPKRRRPDHVDSQTSTAYLRLNEHRFGDQRFEQRSGGASQVDVNRSSSASMISRPSDRQQPASYQQQRQQSHQRSSLSRSTASTASFRLNPAGQPNQHQRQRQPQVLTASPCESPYLSSASQPIPFHLRQATTFLTPTSTFSDATSAILLAQAQEEADTLPRRRKEFEEYCAQAWRHEPALRQLRDEGKLEEARDLFDAAKAALYFARGLGGGGD
ncbi:hypothetical protein WAI453_013378 [Rhynchosporium graminicola]